MEDKLVTLAIHTFEKAQILKTMLETEGIEVYIHNVNQIQPVGKSRSSGKEDIDTDRLFRLFYQSV